MDKDEVRTRLLSKYPPTQSGMWKILGEDPNCDFGGSHHEPELEIVTGEYRNVVEYALCIKDFFSWGRGGRIVEVKNNNLKNIDNFMSNEMIRLESRRNQLQNELLEIDKQILNLKR